jgi:hypothetical protein
MECGGEGELDELKKIINKNLEQQVCVSIDISARFPLQSFLQGRKNLIAQKRISTAIGAMKSGHFFVVSFQKKYIAHKKNHVTPQ